MNIKINEISKEVQILSDAVNYFWNCWGNDTNFKFYEDCISNSLLKDNLLPKFYVARDHDQIIGSYALLVNDLISRQDLYPWFACLFVNEEYRHKGLAGRLLNHGLMETASKGYSTLYLSTDLEGFYERYGWKHITYGFNINDVKSKVYCKKTN